MASRRSNSTIAPVLITAGPTYEPIDRVRFIGNRSSGRLGVELARAAVGAGLETILFLGPGVVAPPHEVARRASIIRFESSRTLEALLSDYWPSRARTLIMAAAVADYRLPDSAAGADPIEKIDRSSAGMTLHLEATPDLVAACSAARNDATQRVIGFALEPATTLNERAIAKLRRKGLDAIVANPLETMDAPDINATLLWADGRVEALGRMMKPSFADWLLSRLIDTASAPVD